MKALILDFGNVIAFFDHRRASRQLASLTGDVVTEESVHSLVFGTSLEADFDCGKLSTPEFIDRLRSGLGLMGPDAVIAKAWCDIFWPNDDVIGLLPRLKRSCAHLLLASNTNELHFNWIASRFSKPLSIFEEFVLSYRIGFRKPAPEFFHRCIESARVAPIDCLYVDDRADFVEIARSLGMKGFVYGPGVSLVQELGAAGVEVL